MKSPLALILITALTLSSCSLLQSTQKSQTATKTEATTTTKKPSAQTNKPKKQPKPQTKPTQTAKPSATETMQAAMASIASLIDGEWKIISVRDVEIDRDEDMPYIYFVTAKQTFYANNGCNTLNGAFTISSDNKIEFANVLSTILFCPDFSFDSQINSVISDGNSWTIDFTETEGEHFIDLMDNNKTIMRLRKGLSSYLDGHWSIESIDGVDHLTAEADIFFDSNELKLHGNTGCNYFNGEIYLDHRIPNAVDFSDIIVTASICPDMAQETALLVALQRATAAKADGNDRLIILNDDGETLLTLRRIQQ